MRYEKNAEVETYLLKWSLEILIWTFLDKIYILNIDFKKHYWK